MVGICFFQDCVSFANSGHSEPPGQAKEASASVVENGTRSLWRLLNFKLFLKYFTRSISSRDMGERLGKHIATDFKQDSMF